MHSIFLVFLIENKDKLRFKILINIFKKLFQEKYYMKLSHYKISGDIFTPLSL